MNHPRETTAFGPNCTLAVCCPPRSAEAKQSLADEIATGLNLANAEAATTPKAVAEWVLDNYDLMPLESTDKLKAEIAALARENP